MKETRESRALRREMMLQLNERLYIRELIPKTLYEQAKLRIGQGEISKWTSTTSAAG